MEFKWHYVLLETTIEKDYFDAYIKVHQVYRLQVLRFIVK